MYGLTQILVVALCVTSLHAHTPTPEQKVADWFANADVGFAYIASNLKALKAGLAAERADIKKLQEALKKANSEHASVKSTLTQVAADLTALSSRAARHNARITNVENALTQQNNIVDSNKRTAASLSSTLTQLQAKVDGIAAKQPSCRAGWTRRHNNCYKYTQCTHSPDCSHDRAQLECWRQGATLAIIRSESDNTFVAGLGGSNPTTYLLIGATDKRIEGTFEWPDGTPVTYSNWYKDEPNNNGGKEHCVVLYKHMSNQWNDGECDFQYGTGDTGYTCQMPVGKVTA